MNEQIPRMKADILKALAHPTRVNILESLRRGERCVCEIIEELDMEQSNVSQHLAVLKKLDIVDSRKEGLRVNYRVKHPEVFQILDLLDGVLVAQVEDTMTTLKSLRQKREKGNNTGTGS
ncbi:MAG TPA: winged helix-turn-helix transcriptional regulator [Desulfotomaculum sp.]|nr:winged helix-turn-helix transcriptional regulator [Desulfotomaculum sp.]